MERINLFSPIFFKSKIDPTSYNKDELYADLKYNYMLNKSRHAEPEMLGDFPATNFHIYYKDWENKNYKKIDFTQLKEQYSLIVEKFISTFKFKTNISYEWYIVNINVGENGFLADHDHIGSYKNDDNWQYQFVFTHYFSLKPHHSTTTFSNPLIPNSNLGQWLDNTDVSNSEYFQGWSLPAEEDDIIIFPAYMKHRVNVSNTTTDDLRITVAVNIVIKAQ